MSALLEDHITRKLTCNFRISQYKVLKELGEGSFGEVKLCELHDRLYAAKVMSKSRLRKRREMVTDETGQITYKDALMDVRREIAIMKKMTHRNVVKLVEVIDDVLSDELIMSTRHLVMDYCQKGQIMDWDEDTQRFHCAYDPRPQLDEETIRRSFRDMVCGLEYCKSHSVHSFKIIHRDLKPQNILVAEDGTVKIADFGVSDIFGADDTLSIVTGTHEFWAPELLSEDLERYSGKAADIWALGLCLYALVYNTHPFLGESYMDVEDNIKEKEVEFPEREGGVSEQLVDLMRRMLIKQPADRIKMGQILQHPWVNREDLPVLRRSAKSYFDITEAELASAFRPVSRFVMTVRGS